MWVSHLREGLGLHTNLPTTHCESPRRLTVTLPRPGRQGRIAKDRAWANRTTRRVMTPSNRLPRTCAQTPWVIDVAKTPLPSRQHAHRLHTHRHVRPSCMTVPGDRDALSLLYQWLPRPAFSPWGSLNINVSRPPSVTVCTTCVHIDMRSAANIMTPSLHCIRTRQPQLHGHCTSPADTRHLAALCALWTDITVQLQRPCRRTRCSARKEKERVGGWANQFTFTPCRFMLRSVTGLRKPPLDSTVGGPSGLSTAPTSGSRPAPSHALVIACSGGCEPLAVGSSSTGASTCAKQTTTQTSLGSRVSVP
jgi:hypothetical protein